jgi:hypothetical protein
MANSEAAKNSAKNKEESRMDSINTGQYAAKRQPRQVLADQKPVSLFLSSLAVARIGKTSFNCTHVSVDQARTRYDDDRAELIAYS